MEYWFIAKNYKTRSALTWACVTESQAIGTHRFLGQKRTNARVKDRVKDKDQDQRPHGLTQYE